MRNLFFEKEKRGLARFLKKDEENVLQYLWTTNQPQSTPEISNAVGLTDQKVQKTLRSLRRRKIVNKHAIRNSPVRWVWNAELDRKQLTTRLVDEAISCLSKILPDETMEVVSAFNCER